MTQHGNIQEQESTIHFKTVEKQRKQFSIKEKRAILEKYDMLPITMTRPSRAESLGLSYTTLVGMLQQREKIFSMKNTAMKKVNYGKEKEVGFATLRWLRYAKARNEKVSKKIVQEKTSVIASRMGKEFLPSESWVSRLCRRGSISLRKSKSSLKKGAVEKIVTSYEAMESLDVVYNFLIQNNGSQSALIALEEIMSFVDEKHIKKASGIEEADKNPTMIHEPESTLNVVVKEEVSDIESGVEVGNFDSEMGRTESDDGISEDSNVVMDPNLEAEDLDVEDETEAYNSNIEMEEPLEVDPPQMCKVALEQYFPCDECESYFESKSELKEHVVSVHSGNEGGTSPKQVKARQCYTIQEKQDIIKRYDLLPKMSDQRKAKMLGVNYITLRRFLSSRDRIFSITNTGLKKVNFGKEKEVGIAVLKWVESARERNEELSRPIIRKKTSEIAREMGRDFLPSISWVARLCKRGNISLKKVETDDKTEASSG